MFILQIINAIISLSTVVAACLSFVRPNVFSGSRHVLSGERFFAAMYAARAIPFGILVGVLPFIGFVNQVPTKMLLVTAALIQVVDVFMGVSRKEWGMVGGATVAAVVHSFTAWLI